MATFCPLFGEKNGQCPLLFENTKVEAYFLMAKIEKNAKLATFCPLLKTKVASDFR